jgi:hypothetical protein
MHFSTTCVCGKSLRVGPALAGRKVRCPACQEVCAIPAPDLEEKAGAILLAGPPRNAAAPARSARRNYSPVPDGTPLPPTRGPRELPVAWRPKAETRQPQGLQPAAEEEDWIGRVNALALGGILVAVLGLAWIGSGQAKGFLLILPALLLAGGVMAVVKGLFGNN